MFFLFFLLWDVEILFLCRDNLFCCLVGDSFELISFNFMTLRKCHIMKKIKQMKRQSCSSEIM